MIPEQQGGEYKTYAETTKLIEDFGIKPSIILKVGID